MDVSKWSEFLGRFTAAEWQAIWMFATFVVALVAAVIGLSQINQVRKSNKAANNANKLASEAAARSLRPYLAIYFDFRPSVPKNPDMTASSGVAQVVIENTGKTAAVDVVLKSLPIFESSNDGVPRDDPDRILRWIRDKFSGDYTFRVIPPGRRYVYILDTTKGLMDPKNNLPQTYVVEAKYRGQADDEEFSESHVLDAEPWHLNPIYADPVEVIAQQFRYKNKNDSKFRKALLKSISNINKSQEPSQDSEN